MESILSRYTNLCQAFLDEKEAYDKRKTKAGSARLRAYSNQITKLGVDLRKDLVAADKASQVKTTDDVLKERGDRYGTFSTHAEISQQLKSIVLSDKLSPSQREALEMICHKIARIVNGDPSYDDSWKDIAGYAELIYKELNGETI